jgi:hypothetical protein
MIFGLFVITLSYGVSFLFPKEVQKSFLIVLSVHALIILFYAYSGIDFIGATEDSDSFYKHAIERSSDINNLNWSIQSLSNGHDLFKNIHAVLQHYFSGPEKLISYSTTLLVWSFCALILARLYLCICQNDFNGASIVTYVYALTPSILIFHSYLLREVWLSLFIFCIIYSAVILNNHQKNLLRILLILFIGLISILFHRYMIVIISATIAILLIYDAINKYSWYPFNNLKLISYFGILAIGSFIVFNLNLEAINFLKVNGLLGAIDEYTIGLVGGHGDGAPPARATYGKIFDKDSLLSIFKVFSAYHLMPYPWKVSSILDLAPLVENFLRGALIILFIVNRKRLSVIQKMNVDMIFLVWLSTEFIWSIGTINWGTGYRHHTVVYGLLVLVALASYRNHKKDRKA